MEGLETTASVYSEAKGEYTKQLTLFILPVFHRFFMTCLQQASQEEPNSKRQLWKFQEILSTVPEWNLDKVQRETTRLVGEIQCDYLEELLTAVFIAHTKVLTAIRIGNKNKRVQITIPKLDHFIHRALSECSRLLWSSAYLFHNELSPIEKQKNHRQIEQLLNDGIAQAIRGLLPVKNILKDYLAEPEDAAEEEDEKEDKDEKDEKDDKENKEDKNETVDTEEKPVEEKKEETVHELAQEETPVAQLVPEPLPIAEPLSIAPEPEVAPVLEAKQEEIKKDELQVPAQSQEPPQPPPTFVVDTEPTVRFTNFNQVIQQKGDHTSIDYVHTDHEEKQEDGLVFLDGEDEDGNISDVEDLTDYPPEPLNTDDFETL
jgi:hypothetical protein